MLTRRRFFSERELRGAHIYDSEGLLYGYVSRIRIGPGSIDLVAVVRAEARSPLPDRSRLVERLRKLGESVADDDPLELLVSRARERGIDIPYTEASTPLELVKGFVPLSEVAAMDIGFVKMGGGAPRRIAVVLLSTPREARYRGSSGRSKPPVPSPSDVSGRLVISRARGLLGAVEEVVFAPGEPGLRVIRGSGGYLSLLRLASELRRRGLREVYEAVAERWDPYRVPRLGLEHLDELREVLRRAGAPEPVEDLLTGSLALEGVEQEDIPWSTVLKVGDAIVVE